jgi:hypothetical protein
MRLPAIGYCWAWLWQFDPAPPLNPGGLDSSPLLVRHDHAHVQPGVLALIAFPPVTSTEHLIAVGSVFAGSRFIFTAVPKNQQKRDDNEYNENPKPVPSFLVSPFLASLLLRRHCWWKVVRVPHCPIVGIRVSPYRGSNIRIWGLVPGHSTGQV